MGILRPLKDEVSYFFLNRLYRAPRVARFFLAYDLRDWNTSGALSPGAFFSEGMEKGKSTDEKKSPLQFVNSQSNSRCCTGPRCKLRWWKTVRVRWFGYYVYLFHFQVDSTYLGTLAVKYCIPNDNNKKQGICLLEM